MAFIRVCVCAFARVCVYMCVCVCVCVCENIFRWLSQNSDESLTFAIQTNHSGFSFFFFPPHALRSFAYEKLRSITDFSNESLSFVCEKCLLMAFVQSPDDSLSCVMFAKLPVTVCSRFDMGCVAVCCSVL